MILRYYQEQAVQAAMTSINSTDQSGLIAMATGTGKALVIAEICKRFVNQTGLPVLVIAHRKRLINQLTATIDGHTGWHVAVEMGEQKSHDTLAKVTVASVPSLARESRRKRYHAERFGLCITDEAHRGASDGHLRVMDHFPQAYRLGLTATPDRADNQKLPFEKILYEYGLEKAISEGFLCPIEAELIPIRIDLQKAKIRMGDFQDRDIDNAITPYLTRIAKEIVSRPDEKHLVFLPLVETSKLFADILNKMGFPAAHLDGESDDCDEVIRDYQEGKYKVLTNCLLFSEGTDIPEVSCITNLRATTSRGTYSQIVGRGTRLHGSKSRLLLLDFLWHSHRHDLCRPASLIADGRVKDKMDEAYRGKGKINLMASKEEAEEAVNNETAQREADALARRIREHEHKQRELIDPLNLKQIDMGGYKQEYEWEGLPPSEKQLEWLKKQGINPHGLTRGMVKVMWDQVVNSDLPSPAQERMLRGRGQWRDGMTKAQASEAIDRIVKKFKRRH